MRMIRTAVAVVIVIGAGLGGLYSAEHLMSAKGAAQGSAPVVTVPRVETVPVTVATFSETVRAVGTTRAIRAVELLPLTSGRVTRIAFAAGDVVSAGQLLLQLDDRAEQAEMKAAEATLAEARAAFDRQQRLRESGSASDASFETARAALLRAEAAHDLARAALEDRSLHAPFDGVVGLTGLVQGQLVGTSTHVTTLDYLAVIEVAFQVPETRLAHLRRGQRVNLTSAAWPGRVFTAELTDIDTRIDATTRSIALRAQIDNADRALTGGMFMQVELIIDQRDHPTVPERALSVDGARELVMVIENGTARQVEVVTGQTRNGMVEIVSGLGPAPEALHVAVSNLQRIRDGMAVDPLPLPGPESRAEVAP